MQTISYLALLGALWKLVDLVTNVTVANIRAVAKQVLAAAVSIGAAFLIGASDFGETWDVGADKVLADMNGASKVILGLIWGLGVGAAVDVKKAIDNRDTAAQPSLPIGTNKTAPAVVDPLGGGQG